MNCTLCVSREAKYQEKEQYNYFCGEKCQLIHYALVSAGQKRERDGDEEEPQEDYFTYLPRDALIAILNRFENIDELVNVCSTNVRLHNLCNSELFRLYYIHFDPKRSAKTAFRWLAGRVSNGIVKPLSPSEIVWLQTMALDTDKYKFVIDSIAFQSYLTRSFHRSNYDFRTGADMNAKEQAESTLFGQIFELLSRKEKNLFFVTMLLSFSLSYTMVPKFYAILQMLRHPDIDMKTNNALILNFLNSYRILYFLLFTNYAASMPVDFMKKAYEEGYPQFSRATKWLHPRVKEIMGI